MAKRPSKGQTANCITSLPNGFSKGQISRIWPSKGQIGNPALNTDNYNQFDLILYAKFTDATFAPSAYILWHEVQMFGVNYKNFKVTVGECPVIVEKKQIQ
ncbi:hypothetical protein RRG08_040795 [Elysia crispata]|uniref:Uncharacterized protein n=1 Tax=Elysia crispata TaxID=231223 RepID=A0AAE1BDT4_9GAST|nr:hypothetical protein RRG08_040795 [Elysia crispata]